MTIRVVPAVVCSDIQLRRLNLHHVPHLCTSIYQSLQTFLLHKEGLATGRCLKNMQNIFLYCIRHMKAIL